MKWVQRVFQLLTRGHRAAQMLRAAREGNRPLVEELLAKGAEVNAKEKDGRTPFHFALMNHHFRVAALLNEYGAKL